MEPEYDTRRAFQEPVTGFGCLNWISLYEAKRLTKFEVHHAETSEKNQFIIQARVLPHGRRLGRFQRRQRAVSSSFLSYAVGPVRRFANGYRLL